MNVITPQDIDFGAYLKQYPEHANVLPAWAYADIVVDYFNGTLGQKGLSLPWSKTHGMVSLRPGEVSIWAGVNGHGKSLILNQIMLQAMKMNEPCVIASMEMKPHVTMARMTRQAAGTERPSDEFIHAFHAWTEGKLWLYAQQGTVDSRRMLAVLRYVHEALYQNGEKVAVRHFVIDSLMKCGIGTDDYNRQKSFVDELCAFAKDSGIHIHLVAHARKGETERKIVDKFDIKGASEITDQVDNVFTIWRNKRKEEEGQRVGKRDDEVMKEPDALLICSKQRHGEWEGRIALWFHREGFQYVAAEGNRPIEFFEYSREAYAI